MREGEPLTLWIEPIITIGAVARLSLEFGWPDPQLGMQPGDWAVDLVAYGDGPDRAVIACPVKKSVDVEFSLSANSATLWLTSNLRRRIPPRPPPERSSADEPGEAIDD